MTPEPAVPPRPLDRARQLLQQGRLDEAERAFNQLLETSPDEPEALSFLAGCALRRGLHGQGIALLERAVRSRPDDARLGANLGIAHQHAGDDARARPLLQRAVDLVPDLYLARLYLAEIQLRAGDPAAALRNSFNALRTAQAQGQWRTESSTPPGLLERVRQAMRRVNQGRRDLFSGVLEPLRARYGRDALDRVEQSLSLYLGDAARSGGDPRQQPKFLYFPGLPAQPFLDRTAIAWLPELESRTDVIRDEARSVLTEPGALRPFLTFTQPGDAGKYLGGSGAKPRWDAFFFFRHGERHPDNCRRCPATAAVLDALPLVRIRQHAPEICFSVLTPGTHILPHYGVTNTRVVVHLPLIVKGGCALRAGGETHEWQEGRATVFDDTYEHEAWNRGTEDRVILLMDAWSPYLSEAERAALTDLVAAIGDFNRESKVAAES